MPIKRAVRVRLDTYASQLHSLGIRRWVHFKVQVFRSRFAKVGHEYSISTPLALHPLKFRTKSSDLKVFAQIFVEQEYRGLHEISDVKLIVDCGANSGYSSAYFLTKYPDARVIAIEPDIDNYNLLRKNVRPYGDRCVTIQSAVWSSPAALVVQQAPPGAEWATTVRPAAEGDLATIEAIDIPTVLRESGQDRISVLKVDIEGAEVEMFARNSSLWLDSVDNIAIELHDDVCRATFMSAIARQDFELSESGELTICRRVAR